METRVKIFSRSSLITTYKITTLAVWFTQTGWRYLTAPHGATRGESFSIFRLQLCSKAWYFQPSITGCRTPVLMSNLQCMLRRSQMDTGSFSPLWGGPPNHSDALTKKVKNVDRGCTTSISAAFSLWKQRESDALRLSGSAFPGLLSSVWDDWYGIYFTNRNS